MTVADDAKTTRYDDDRIGTIYQPESEPKYSNQPLDELATVHAAVCLVAFVKARDRRVGHERDGLDLDIPPRSSVTRITGRDEPGDSTPFPPLCPVAVGTRQTVSRADTKSNRLCSG
jgi:hypothetical protein